MGELSDLCAGLLAGIGRGRVHACRHVGRGRALWRELLDASPCGEGEDILANCVCVGNLLWRRQMEQVMGCLFKVSSGVHKKLLFSDAVRKISSRSLQCNMIIPLFTQVERRTFELKTSGTLKTKPAPRRASPSKRAAQRLARRAR